MPSLLLGKRRRVQRSSVVRRPTSPIQLKQRPVVDTPGNDVASTAAHAHEGRRGGGAGAVPQPVGMAARTTARVVRDRLCVGTFNIRNTTDRYDERAALIADVITGLFAAGAGEKAEATGSVPASVGTDVGAGATGGAPEGEGASRDSGGGGARAYDVDLLGLQEVAFEYEGDEHTGADAAKRRQTGWLRDLLRAQATAASDGRRDLLNAFEGRTAHSFVPPHPGFRIDGNAILAAAHADASSVADMTLPSTLASDAAGGAASSASPPLLRAHHRIEKHEHLRLSDVRSAHRLIVRLAGSGERVVFVNCHLDHELTEESEDSRAAQSQMIVDWVDAVKDDVQHAVVVGDFNMAPDGRAYAVWVKHGFRSAHQERHGCEPEYTFHNRLISATSDLDPPLTTDYVWVRSGPRTSLSLEVRDVAVVATEAHKEDGTLMPSDHYGIVAELEFADGRAG